MLCVFLVASCFHPSSALAFTTPLVAKKFDTKLQAKSLEGCVCVVTGASRGIGKGIAVALGKEGPSCT